MEEVVQQYIKNLEQMNGHCGCLNLSKLHSIKQEASELEKKCDNQRVRVTSIPLFSRSSAQRYSILVKKFEDKVEDYNGEMLRLLADSNALELQLYDGKSYNPVKKISLVELQEMKHLNPILSLNCSDCKQQIDLVD